MGNKEVVYNITKKSKKLKDLGDGINIYIKNDKTKAEREEFQRLGKRKDDIAKQYPKADEQPDRVILERGVLKLDGVEVDRYKSPQTLF